MHAIGQGSRYAMELLYLRYRVQVYRFVLRLTRNVSLAEDLVADTFLDVWRQADRFQQRAQLSTWLLAIARNKWLSAARKHAHEPLDVAGGEDLVDSADDPEVSLEKSERASMLRACLSQLSATHREVIDLTYYHDKTIEEVATIVGAPVNTIKTRMFHARRRLQDLLRQFTTIPSGGASLSDPATGRGPVCTARNLTETYAS